MTILDLFVKYNKNTSKQFLNHSNSFKLLFKHFQTTVVLVRATTDSKLIERRKSQTDRNEIKVTAMLRLTPVHLQNDLDFVLPGESTRNSVSQ